MTSDTNLAASHITTTVEMQIHARTLGVRGLSVEEAKRYLKGYVFEMDTKDLGNASWQMISAEPAADGMWNCVATKVHASDYAWNPEP